MVSRIDLLQLAAEITEIAAATSERETARRLLELVDQLLSRAGLPDASEGGGGPPPGALHAAQAGVPEVE